MEARFRRLTPTREALARNHAYICTLQTLPKHLRQFKTPCHVINYVMNDLEDFKLGTHTNQAAKYQRIAAEKDAGGSAFLGDFLHG